MPLLTTSGEVIISPLQMISLLVADKEKFDQLLEDYTI